MDELDNIIEQKWAKIILIHNIMDTFHKIVIGVALFILLAMLIIIGVMLQRSKKNELYPPVATKCPDYWTEVEDGCQENILNNDEQEINIPKLGIIPVEEKEDNFKKWINTSSNEFQKMTHKLFKNDAEDLKREINSVGINYLKINSKENYIKKLIKLFKYRKNK